MRYYEFSHPLNEDIDKGTVNALNSILDFIEARIDKEDASSRISSNLIINLMQNRGFESFNYKDLLAVYNENPELQSRISKPEKNGTFEFTTDSDVEPLEIDQEQQPADIAQDQPIDAMNPTPGEPLQTDMSAQPEQPMSSEPSGPIEGPEGTEQTVRTMAKKALKRRQE
jgi:hypothetical protein